MIDRIHLLLVPLVLFALVSCERTTEEETSAADWDGTGVGWTTDLISRIPEVSREAQLVGLAPIQEVRTEAGNGFDRMVIEIEGRGMPNYEVEYAVEPLQYCETGEPIQLDGAAMLQLRLEPARAHDERGRVLFSNTGEKTGLPVLVEQLLVCDRSGSVEWAIGVASPNSYRVIQLTELNRLVLDVRHEN